MIFGGRGGAGPPRSRLALGIMHIGWGCGRAAGSVPLTQHTRHARRMYDVAQTVTPIAVVMTATAPRIMYASWAGVRR